MSEKKGTKCYSCCASVRHQTNLYLQIGCEGIREPHVPWEGTEDEVAELDAVGRNDITEAVMIVAQELWEVMQQNQKHSQCTLEPKKTKVWLKREY